MAVLYTSAITHAALFDAVALHERVAMKATDAIGGGEAVVVIIEGRAATVATGPTFAALGDVAMNDALA